MLQELNKQQVSATRALSPRLSDFALQYSIFSWLWNFEQ